LNFVESFHAWRRRRAAGTPWLGVHAGESALLGALCGGQRGGKPLVQLLEPGTVAAQAATLRQWRRRLPRQVRANVVLRSAEYRVVPVEAPDIPEHELRDAARWQVADLLDFSAEAAAIDLLTVPSRDAARRQRFVVAAPDEHVRHWLECCREAQLALAAVDIPEMSMRNLSVLAAGDTAHAFVHVGARSTRLALVWKRELCSFRQLDISGRELDSAADRDALVERLALEVQRSADSFSRQFSGIELEGLWLASAHDPEALADQLALHVAQRVQLFDLERHVEVDGEAAVFDRALGHDHLLAIGAALRREAD